MKYILAYIRKDIRLELHRGYALGGLFVFVLCLTLIIYLSFREIDPASWITIYWIAFLFMAVHSVLKGFTMESQSRYIYYYMLLRPEQLFIAKALYNTLIVSILGLLLYGSMSLVTVNPVSDHALYFLAIFLGAAGISLCFTFVSAVAVKSDQSATLMTILSFPLIIPVLLHLIRIAQASLPESMIDNILPSLLTLGAIDLLLIGLALLLFPYLWRS